MTTPNTTPTKPHDHPPTDPAPAPGGLTDEQIEIVAHAAHEAMNAYGRALRHNNLSPYEQSPDWQKEEARGFARTIAGGKKLDTHDHKLTKVELVKRKIAAAVIPAVIDAITED